MRPKRMVPRAAARSLIGAIDRYIAKADRDFRDEIEAEGFLVADEAAAAEEALEDGMTGAINEHVDGVLESLGNASGLERYIKKTWPEVQKETELRDRLHDLFYEQFSKLLHAGVVAYLKEEDAEIGAAAEEDGRVTPYAVDFINGWSGKLAEIMHLSTDRQINKILVDTAEKHLSVSDAALEIGRSDIRSPGAKSRLVAQTEVLRVESYSQLEAMRQDPAVKEKEWFHTGSHKNKPRENHVAMSGQTVPVDQPFSLTGRDGGSYSPMVPRDTGLPAGESINCHCIMRQKKDSKVLGLSADERKALRERYLNQVEDEWEAAHIGTTASAGDAAPASKLPPKFGAFIPDQELRKEIIARGIKEKRAIFSDGQLGELAKGLPPEPGYYDVVTHGWPNHVEFFEHHIDVETLCAIIAQRKDYVKGTDIRLISCYTGYKEDGVAQYVANKLKVNVLAPDKLGIINRSLSGKYSVYSGSKIGAHDGEFILFKPQE